MATRKGINISGHYVVSINDMPFHIIINDTLARSLEPVVTRVRGAYHPYPNANRG